MGKTQAGAFAPPDCKRPMPRQHGAGQPWRIPFVTTEERNAIAAICLMAALADGQKDAREREQLKGIYENLGDPSMAEVLQRVLMKKTTLAEEAASLTSDETRMLAFELAVCVCDADEVTSPEEQRFLDTLRGALGLNTETTAPVEQAAAAIAAAAPAIPVTMADDAPAQTAPPIPPAPAMPASTPPAVMPAQTSAAPDPAPDIDASIKKYAILCAALELLPQSLATMAVVPLQMKLVYEIGQRHGYALDRAHIKEFIAIAGVGLGAQVVEQYARKLLGGVLRMAGGKMLGGLGKSAAGPAVAFATTYALGQVAKQYYGGGRSMRDVDLKALFSSELTRAQGLYGDYAGAVQQQAKTVNLTQLFQSVKS